MTRTEFVENVESWGDLREFCLDYDCDICCDVYDDDEKDDYINDMIEEIARDSAGWQDLLETLNCIPCAYGYYIHMGGWEFRIADDDDFDSLKDEVLDWADNEGNIWEDDGDQFEEEVEEEPAFAVEDEGCTIVELMASGASFLLDLGVHEIAEKEAEDAAFSELLS